VGGGAYAGWTIDGDDGDTEAIASGNTLLVAGGSNGIDTDVSATDTITLNLDTTEIGTSTFGSGSGFNWTMNMEQQSVLVFGSGTVANWFLASRDYGAMGQELVLLFRSYL
jgi:hypothetical protein